MKKTGILGALLLVVGLLVGGGIVSMTKAQHWPVIWDDLYLDPDRYVVIEEGTPYTVPHGWALLITRLSSDDSSGVAQLTVSINGNLVLASSWHMYAGGPKSLEPGVVARSGDVVDVQDTGASNLGYGIGRLYRPK